MHSTAYTSAKLLILIALFAPCEVISQLPPQPPSIHGQGVATYFSGFIGGSPTYGIRNDYVVAIVDVHDPIAPPSLWSPPMYHGPGNSWRAGNLGQVFGIAIDKRNNIYVAATTAYGSYNDPLAFGPGGSGAIYRLDGTTGLISTAAGSPGTFITTASYTLSPSAAVGTSTLPNGNGTTVRPGLGNICYAARHDRLFVTNMEDGVIYRVNPLIGRIDAFYDPVASPKPGGTANPAMTVDKGTLGVAPLGDRIWGIGFNPITNRLYYSVWVEDYGTGGPGIANVVRSIALDSAGMFQPSTDRLEVVVPEPPFYHPYTLNSTGRSAPVSDIAFSSTGRMLLAERTMTGSSRPGAHGARVLEYSGAWPDWSAPKQTFVGEAGGTLAGQNGAGGVDYGYGRWSEATNDPMDCDSVIWASGDLLSNATNFTGIHGLQRSPASGNGPSSVQTTGYFIDLNGLSALQSDDESRIGDVEIFRSTCDTSIMEPACNNLSIVVKKDGSFGLAACCFTVTLTNNDSTTTYRQFEATSGGSGVEFENGVAPSGWRVGGTEKRVIWSAPPAGIPLGTTGLSFCLNIGQNTPPHPITFTWTTAEGRRCTTNVQIDCSPPAPSPGCGRLMNLRAQCLRTSPEGNVYRVVFQLSSQSLVNVVTGLNIVGVTPAGMGISRTTFGFTPGIPIGSTSSTQTLDLFSPHAVGGDTVCLRFIVNDSTTAWCCIVDTCFILPDCAAGCEGIRIDLGRGLSGSELDHNGAGTSTIATSVTVGPSLITRASATLVSAEMKRSGCSPTAGWVPVSGEITAQQTSFAGLPISPPVAPFGTRPSPGYSEVRWGTLPAGVSLGTPTQLALHILFPPPPPATNGCFDSVRFAVRYSFTDVNNVTCDTLVHYVQKRVGRALIDRDARGSTMHSQRVGSITMTSATEGSLTVALPTVSPDAPPGEGVRIVGVGFQPFVGVRLALFNGELPRDNTGSATIRIEQGGSASFDLAFDNYAPITSWGNLVIYRYVLVGAPNDTLETDEVVVARVPGDVGGDTLATERGTTRPTDVRTFLLYFVNGNPLAQATAEVDITPLYNGSIIAIGPPPERNGTVTLAPVADGSNGVTLRAAGDGMDLVAGSVIRPIYLTVTHAGEGKQVRLEYVSRNGHGEEIGRGILSLDDPLSASRPDDPRVERVADGLRLWPVTPNPSGDDRVIRFRLPHPCTVDLGLYDVAGREERRIIDGIALADGDHVVVLSSVGLAPGTYYILLSTPSGSTSEVMNVSR